MPAASVTTRTLIRTSDDLSDDNLPDGPWLLARTRSQQEKALARDCDRLGLSWVLPVEERSRTYKHKGTQLFEVPLIGGYLPILADDHARYDLQCTGRIVTLETVLDSPEFASELRAMIQLIKAAELPTLPSSDDDPQRPHELIIQPGIKAGKRVRVVSGALAGWSGIVDKRQGRSGLFVNLTMFGQHIRATIDAEVVTIDDDDA
ncbi:MAG: transcription termination/antitermination protein NusG [Planctomycetota bacterium]|jgi:hypothetical protein